MQRYELQILDGYRNPTYADGTVGSIYAWKPPLVNPSRKPGEWQSYDIIFERPHFAPDGKLLRPAYITAFLNGVLVQNRQPWLGRTVRSEERRGGTECVSTGIYRWTTVD